LGTSSGAWRTRINACHPKEHTQWRPWCRSTGKSQGMVVVQLAKTATLLFGGTAN